MVDVEELKQENQNILNLTQVLHHLIEVEKLRNNPVFCELMERFNKSVEAHLAHEDRTVYSDLLNHDERQIHMLADQFISNTHELRRLMADYTKKWCKSEAGDHAVFVEKTREIFSLVDMRINLEDSKLFPAIAGLD